MRGRIVIMRQGWTWKAERRRADGSGSHGVGECWTPLSAVWHLLWWEREMRRGAA